MSPSESPTRAGLRAVLCQPRVLFAEIAWRWLFGGCSLLLAALLFVRIIGRVEVSDADFAALGADDPVTIANALMRIFEGAVPALVRMAYFLAPAVVLLWALAATLGRAATLQMLLGLKQRPPLAALAQLSLLRVLLTVATMLGFFGAALLGAFVSTRNPEARPNWLLYLTIVFVLWTLVLILWGWLTWVLSLAPLFAVRDGLPVMRSIAVTIQATNIHRRAFFSVSTAYGLLRVLAIGLVLALTVVAALLAGSSLKLALILIALITLVYFAIADFLYIGRLAAYACIAKKQAADETGSVSV